MIKHALAVLLFVFAFTTTASAQADFRSLDKYEVYFGTARRFGKTWLTLRRFEDHGRKFLLLVDQATLNTRTDLESNYTVQQMPLADLRAAFKYLPYVRALSSTEQHSVAVQDAGIERGLPKETGISLTADLCPSHRSLDKRIFVDILNEFKAVERPVPVALSVSGLWLNKHQQDLAWLKQMQNDHEINITWVNHSYKHRVSLKAPLKRNFLLEPGTNINYEVLETERDMLRNGLLPSVFFRFPGLVSDQQLVYEITGFGLIPIGTDAWLAKGQQPRAGSIVLIHGNGNEPIGVTDFIELLKSKAADIAHKQWLLYDLRQTVDDEFEQ
ncbi:polysaccharide deacetylase [Mucilaginibacter terrenus]|uniref:Polysaccharide deacetylase n=1 Tax=Mucilaginibacter terrenus TaxID=2482727 RepID=A0A3E2NKZ2_9SPHI|nr:polysaccharide deacetylase [Mucilaginibacter terrenus]RFZ81656.1 polysaccharide deacetylase [Mucilaginibacter terrenus]